MLPFVVLLLTIRPPPISTLFPYSTLFRSLAGAVAKQIGAQNVLEARPEMVAEDFGEFGKAAGAPSVLLRVGAAEPSKYEAAQKSGTPLPSLHSSGFAPDRGRTLKTAAAALTLSALQLLGKPWRL